MNPVAPVCLIDEINLSESSETSISTKEDNDDSEVWDEYLSLSRSGVSGMPGVLHDEKDSSSVLAVMLTLLGRAIFTLGWRLNEFSNSSQLYHGVLLA